MPGFMQPYLGEYARAYPSLAPTDTYSGIEAHGLQPEDFGPERPVAPVPAPGAMVSPEQWRTSRGIIDVPPAPAPAPVDPWAAGDAAARARILSGAGAWQPDTPEWGGDVAGPGGTMLKSAAQTNVDLGAEADIVERYLARRAAIDQSAVDPMGQQIHAANQASVYEGLTPKQRPLYDVGDPQAGGVAGAFHKGADGTISNRAPAMRIGPERSALITQAPEMRKQAAAAQLLTAEQERIKNEMQQYQQSGGKLGLAPEAGRQQLERLSGMALQAILGGEDFANFFRPDPMSTMALMMGGQAAKE